MDEMKTVLNNQKNNATVLNFNSHSQNSSNTNQNSNNSSGRNGSSNNSTQYSRRDNLKTIVQTYKYQNNSNATNINEYNNFIDLDKITAIITGPAVTEKYNVLEKLNTASGEAVLYKVESKATKEILVFKIYFKHYIKTEVFQKIKNIGSKYVTKIVDFGFINEYFYVILPFYAKGSVRNLLTKNKTLTTTQIVNDFLPNVAQGLYDLHKVGIIHKDLKPDNIMIDDNNNFVIIDFGVSANTNNENTVVLTQTGISPSYLAPEAFKNTYTKETDYYALGIIIYELFTGYTPYNNQRFSKEKLASLASVQKIPFPTDFPTNLKDLVTALTYIDISNRNDKNNPNRRWGYEDISKWLKGEKLIIPGSTNLKDNNDSNFENAEAVLQKINYKFKGQIYTNRVALFESFAKNWNDGIKELGRGYIEHYFDNQNQNNEVAICKEYSNKIANVNQNIDEIYQEFLYKIEPNLHKICWKGLIFNDIEDYAKALVNYVYSDNPNAQVGLSIDEFLNNGFLEFYIQREFKDEVLCKQFIDSINSAKKVFKAKNLNSKYQALKLAQALTGNLVLYIDGVQYHNTAKLFALIDKIYNQDDNLKAFTFFYGRNQKELESIKLLFSDDEIAKLNDFNNKYSSIIISSKNEYRFRNLKELLDYAKTLYDNHKNLDLYKLFVTTKNSPAYKKQIAKPENNQIYNEYLDLIDNLVIIDERVFGSMKEYEDTLAWLKKTSEELYQNFQKSHQVAIQALRFKHKKVGDLVTFGKNEFINNTDNKLIANDINWQIIDIDEESYTLLSEVFMAYPFSEKKYDENDSWECCSLRCFFKGPFISKAFSDAERKVLMTNTNQTRNSNNTKDKVWILDDKEYLYYSKKMNIEAAFSASIKNEVLNNGKVACYWLRSPSFIPSCQQFVDSEGEILAINNGDTNIGVRAVIKIKKNV